MWTQAAGLWASFMNNHGRIRDATPTATVSECACPHRRNSLRGPRESLGYSNYSVAGFTAYPSDCADHDDPNATNGLRSDMNRNDYKTLVLIPYVR